MSIRAWVAWLRAEAGTSNHNINTEYYWNLYDIKGIHFVKKPEGTVSVPSHAIYQKNNNSDAVYQPPRLSWESLHRQTTSVFTDEAGWSPEDRYFPLCKNIDASPLQECIYNKLRVQSQRENMWWIPARACFVIFVSTLYRKPPQLRCLSCFWLCFPTINEANTSGN